MEEIKSFYTILESDLIFDKRINSTTKIIYAMISSYSNNKVGYCFLNHNQIAQIVGITKRQMSRCIQDLKKYKYITIIRKNNRYYLMPSINVVSANRKLKNNPTQIPDFIDYDWLNQK